MAKVYLSLGSNIGDRVSYLKQAILLIQSHKDINNVKVSSFYETDPQGYTDQDYFVNCVIECYTLMTPFELLEFTQYIEKKLKRVKLFRWGPRTIDVDILLYGELIINSEDLIIPHPRMYERAFVLIPLNEINSEFSLEQIDLSNQIVKIIK